jgi:hypothetical protein
VYVLTRNKGVRLITLAYVLLERVKLKFKLQNVLGGFRL